MLFQSGHQVPAGHQRISMSCDEVFLNVRCSHSHVIAYVTPHRAWHAAWALACGRLDYLCPESCDVKCLSVLPDILWEHCTTLYYPHVVLTWACTDISLMIYIITPLTFYCIQSPKCNLRTLWSSIYSSLQLLVVVQYAAGICWRLFSNVIILRQHSRPHGTTKFAAN